MISMGALYIVSTPIGNLEDITVRAQKTLASVDLILCEDTRRTGILLMEVSHPSMKKKDAILRFDDHTENKKIPEIIQMLEAGENIALVSDAGTPLISDPGYRLVSECIKRGIGVISIPGPSAVLAALTSSGLPANRFLFLGYPPEKQSHRKKLFQSMLLCFETLEQRPTIVFYCAPHKIQRTLEDMKDIFGDIEIVIARELTKIHEEIWRGKLSEAQNTEFKGELVLLFSLGVPTISPPR